MTENHRRHDLSDQLGEVLESLLPGRSGSWGGVVQGNRLFLHAVMWILRTGFCMARDLPGDYGDRRNTHRRLCPWRDKGPWENHPAQLLKAPDCEWMMIDPSHVEAHAEGAVG